MKRLIVSDEIINEVQKMLSEGYKRQDVLLSAFMCQLDTKSNDEIAEYYMQVPGYLDHLLNDLFEESPKKNNLEISKYFIALHQLKLGYKDQLKKKI